MTLPRLALLFVALTVCGGACLGQNQETSTTTTAPPPAPTPPPRPQFFAGTVTAIADDQIIVSRTLVGHPPDTRTFILTPKTKLNRGICKPDAKVTVRYLRQVNGNVALQVLVHSESKPVVAKQP